jgi:hypothetical protein
MASKRERTDDDYVRLDDAISTMLNWWPEIVTELAKRNVSERYLSEVKAAMDRVHSPDEE